MKGFAYFLTASAVITTIAIGLYTVDDRYTLVAVAIITWSVSPYALLALLIKLSISKLAQIASLAISIMAIVFGLALIIDAMFIHLDAQGGLIYLVAPLWQWVGLLILTLPVVFLNKEGNSKQGH